MRLNLKFLLILIAAAGLFAAGVGGVHQLQVRRLSMALLGQARAAAERNDMAAASRFYSQFLDASPASTDASIEYGYVLKESGRLREAMRQFERALQMDASRSDVRAELVDIYVEIDRPLDAKRHLQERLILNDPENAEWYWLLGCCEREISEFAEARAHFEVAVQREPKSAKYARDLANLVSDQFSDSLSAHAILNELVNRAGNDPEVFVTRGSWLLDQSAALTTHDNELRDSRLDAAWQDAKQTLRLAPKSPQSVVFAAEVALARGKTDDVQTLLHASLESQPRVAEIYGSAAQIELNNGNRRKAIQFIQDGLRSLPGDPDLMWNLASLYLEVEDYARYDALIEELRQLEYPAAPLRFLEARRLIADGKWRQAAGLIEKTRAFFDRDDALTSKADYLLARCYACLGNGDQQLEALRRVVNADPHWVQARQSLAEALLRTGRSQEALMEYWQLSRQPNPPLSALASLARLLIIDAISRDDTDWTRFDQVVATLEKSDSVSNIVAILRAEQLAANNRLDAAETLLRGVIESAPDSLKLRQALFGLLLQSRHWDDALTVLKECDARFPDSAVLRLERARYEILRNGRSVDVDQLVRLSHPNPTWSENEQVTLASGFAGLFLSLEEFEECQKNAQRVASSDDGKSNLAVHLLLFDLALRRQDSSDMRSWLERVKEIEGEGPLWHVGQAVRICIDTEQKTGAAHETFEQTAGYTSALEHLKEAASERPSWSRIPRLQGEIYFRQQLRDMAIDKYLEAIRLGERDPRLISRAVLLLFEEGRFVEADEVFRKLSRQRTPFSPELIRVASEVSLQLENYDRALTLAKDWAESSQAREDRIWLAQMYCLTRRFEEAEVQFRQAIEMEPESPAAWVSLVQMHGRIDEKETAYRVIEEAKKAIVEEELAFAIAQCYESIDDPDLAADYYQRALQLRGDDAVVLRRFADFCLHQGRKSQGQTLLERLVGDEFDGNIADQAWARRNLALCLAMEGDDAKMDRAKKLIAKNQTRIGKTLQDQRTLGVILGTRADRKSVDDAIAILEDVIARQAKFSLDDNYLLAELYRRTGQATKYSRVMRSVLGNGGADNAKFVGNYADTLIQRGEYDEAQLWSEQLNRIAPNQLPTDNIEIQLLFYRANFQHLLELLKSRAASQERLRWSAEAAERVGVQLKQRGNQEWSAEFLEFAEHSFSRIAGTDSGQSHTLACYHARQGNIELALERDSGFSPQQLAVLVRAALGSGRAQDDQLETLIEWVEQAKTRATDDLDLSICLGDLHSWRNDWQPASAAYRNVLKQDPSNITVLNNLAMVYALSGQQLQQAEEAINLAISLCGDRDQLLDTRGVVRLAAGRVKPAEEDFREALQSESRADRFFHLAQALFAQQRVEAARQAFSEACRGGISVDTLHPLERPAFDRLEELLDGSGRS